MKPLVTYKDWGTIPYKIAWDKQKALLQEVVNIKRNNRELKPNHPDFLSHKNYLIFCNHPPVYTLGKSGSLDHLLLDEAKLREKQIEFYKINRGGDITFHGPGQVVGYPIFNLDLFFTDIRKYLRFLEEAVIRTLKEFDIEGYREEAYTGVWLKPKGFLPKRKICAIGVHLSRWVTMHGFAFNVNTDLSYFRNIVPCGINDRDKDVTSLAFELGQTVDIEHIKSRLKAHFKELFEFEFD